MRTASEATKLEINNVKTDIEQANSRLRALEARLEREEHDEKHEAAARRGRAWAKHLFAASMTTCVDSVSSNKRTENYSFFLDNGAQVTLIVQYHSTLDP